MIHLSLTGWGSTQDRRLCTAPAEGSDTNWHAMYCSTAQLAGEAVCPACRYVWYSAYADDPRDA
jgi:hypothetical protein